MIDPELRQAINTVADWPLATSDYASAIWHDVNCLIELARAIKSELDRDLVVEK